MFLPKEESDQVYNEIIAFLGAENIQDELNFLVLNMLFQRLIELDSGLRSYYEEINHDPKIIDNNKNIAGKYNADKAYPGALEVNIVEDSFDIHDGYQYSVNFVSPMFGKSPCSFSGQGKVNGTTLIAENSTNKNAQVALVFIDDKVMAYPNSEAEAMCEKNTSLKWAGVKAKSNKNENPNLVGPKIMGFQLGMPANDALKLLKTEASSDKALCAKIGNSDILERISCKNNGIIYNYEYLLNTIYAFEFSDEALKKSYKTDKLDMDFVKAFAKEHGIPKIEPSSKQKNLYFYSDKKNGYQVQFEFNNNMQVQKMSLVLTEKEAEEIVFK